MEKESTPMSSTNDDLESKIKLNKSLKLKVNELTALATAADDRSREQLKRIASLEMEYVLYITFNETFIRYK